MAIPRVWLWLQDARDRVTDDFSPRTRDEFLEMWESRAERRWGVWAGEDLCGLIAMQPVNPVTACCHVTLKKQCWGRGIARRALHLALTEAFAAGLERAFSNPYADNHTVISLFKALGFSVEGRLRHHTRQGGKPRDLILLGLLKGELKCLG